MSLWSRTAPALFKLNAPPNAAAAWKQRFEIGARASDRNKEEKCSPPTSVFKGFLGIVPVTFTLKTLRSGFSFLFFSATVMRLSHNLMGIFFSFFLN